MALLLSLFFRALIYSLQYEAQSRQQRREMSILNISIYYKYA